MSAKKPYLQRSVLDDDLDEVMQDGIACYGLLSAIHSQYVYEGVLSIGALLYCIQIIDRMNSRTQEMWGEGYKLIDPQKDVRPNHPAER